MALFIQQGQLDTEVVVLRFFFIGDIVGNTTSVVNSGCDFFVSASECERT